MCFGCCSPLSELMKSGVSFGTQAVLPRLLRRGKYGVRREVFYEDFTRIQRRFSILQTWLFTVHFWSSLRLWYDWGNLFLSVCESKKYNSHFRRLLKRHHIQSLLIKAFLNRMKVWWKLSKYSACILYRQLHSFQLAHFLHYSRWE